MEFVQIAGNLSASQLRNHRDDDMFIDRLAHRYSVVLFTIFAILVTSKAYIGDPIDCWAPPEFKSSYERYAETLCFVNGTYHISVNEIDIPIDPKHRYYNRIRYYQWTPFILLFQAFLMYFPRFLWLTFNSRYGINLRNLVDAAKKYESLDCGENREKILAYLCRNLLRSIQYKDYHVLNGKEPTNESIVFNKNELSKIFNMYQPSTLLNENQLPLTTPLTIFENEIKKTDPKNKGVRLSKQDSELYTAYAKIESTHNQRSSSSSTNISKSKKYKVNEQNCEIEDISLNMLRARINTISRKHLLNVFSSGYETTNHSINEGRRNTKLEEYSSSSFVSKIKSFSFLPDLNNNYLSYLYIFVKFCYLLSFVCQVLILNRLIGNSFYMLGINLIKSFLTDMEWPHLTIFPRISLCEIYIREIGTIHPYLIQCVLRINLFNELIFILVWFWLLFVITITALDLGLRLIYVIFGCSNCRRKLFALKYLELIHLNSTSKIVIDNIKNIKKTVQHVLIEEEQDHELKKDLRDNDYDNNEFSQIYDNNFECTKKKVNRYVLVKATKDEEFDLFEKFCDNHFTNDTIFALRIIQQNASNLIISEVIEYLWRQFKMLNFVYSNETNDFFLKRVIVSSPSSIQHQQQAQESSKRKETKKSKHRKQSNTLKK